MLEIDSSIWKQLTPFAVVFKFPSTQCSFHGSEHFENFSWVWVICRMW